MEQLLLERLVFFLCGYNRLLEFEGTISAGQSILFSKPIGFVTPTTISYDFYIGTVRRQFVGVSLLDIIYGPITLSVTSGQVTIYSIKFE